MGIHKTKYVFLSKMYGKALIIGYLFYNKIMIFFVVLIYLYIISNKLRRLTLIELKHS